MNNNNSHFKEPLSRRKTHNPDYPVSDEGLKKMNTSSFTDKKLKSNEKSINLQDLLANTQSELYEALESEFKLKENVIGLERHLHILASENKMLHSTHRKSIDVLNVMQKLTSELNNLKKANTDLHAGAIDALVEKEKKIIELNELLIHTEDFYKVQLETSRNEVKTLQQRLWESDLSLGSPLRPPPKELDCDILLKRIQILENELELKEKEHKNIVNNIENEYKNQNEEKKQHDLSLLISQNDHLLRKSMTIIDQAEEKVSHYQILSTQLQNQLTILDQHHKKEIEILENKFIEKEKNIEDNHKKQINIINSKFDNQIREFQSIINSKNEYITQQENGKDLLLKRITTLEGEQKKNLNENSRLTETLQILMTQNQTMHQKMEELVTKHDGYIAELKENFYSEKRMLNFELRHIKKMTNEESMVLSNNPFRKRNNSEEYKSKQNSSIRRSLVSKKAFSQMKQPSLDIDLALKKVEFDEFSNKNGTSYNKNSKIQECEINEENIENINLPALYPFKPIDLTDSDSNYDSIDSRIKKTLNKSVQTINLKEKEQKESFALEPDFELCRQFEKHYDEEKPNEQQKSKIKRESKFFLMDYDSDESQTKKDKIGSYHSFFSKSLIPKVNSKPSDQNTKAYYLDDISKKIKNASDILSDYLRNFQDKTKTEIPLVSESIQVKFQKIHQNINNIYKKLRRDQFIISHELLKKTIEKIDSQTLKTLNYYTLIVFSIEGYIKNSQGFIEYKLILEDKIINRQWKFNERYSKIRSFYKECENYIENISKIKGKQEDAIPPFPPKKWFGNQEDEFLRIRQKELENFFLSLLKSPLCYKIIDKGLVKHFFYSEIWRQKSQQMQEKIDKIKDFNDILTETNLKGEINFDKMGIVLKEELNKVLYRFSALKNDLEVLEQSDTLCILRYEEERKKKENESSHFASFVGD